VTAYCALCGIKNNDGAGSCTYCGAELAIGRQGSDDAAREEQKLYLNMTDRPIGSMLREWKVMNLTLQLFFPVLMVIIVIKKLFRRPLLGAVLNTATPKYRAATEEEISRLNPRKTYGPTMANLEKQGYRHYRDLSCLHYPHAVIKRLFVNRDQTRYATIYINAATGKMQFLSLEAFTRGKKYITLVNRESLPITLPKNIIFQAVHGASPGELTKAFEGVVAKNGEALAPLSPDRYLRLHFRVDQLMIDQAIRQGLFLTEHPGKGRPPHTVSTCANHPMRAAARGCSACGALLCESCYSEYNGAPHCSHCLSGISQAATSVADGGPPAATASTPPVEVPRLERGYQFAGLGARGLSKLIDLVLIFGVVAGAAYGLNLGLRTLAGPYATGLAIALVQLLAALAAIFYFTIVFQRLGGGVGHRLLGMRVVGKDGQTPALISIGIRSMYHLLTCLFIFPAVGYLVIPFRRKKRGWHDTLADTWVITRHPKRLGLISWLTLLSICTALGWVVRGYFHYL
jgi:uncharacterized RDD family membrane protein YckC